MFTYSKAFYRLKQNLQPLYDERESAAIAHLLMEHITGLSKIERLQRKEELLTEHEDALYAQLSPRLLKGEPLQYVTGIAWFMERPFHVNPHVLIPRPETEELVFWIKEDWKKKKELSILDIGSGSGCIPVSLKKELPGAVVSGCDVCTDALYVAAENAASLNAEVDFLLLDFLEESKWDALARYDVIVSNPPYITLSEKDSLHQNVQAYEPSLALFVPDNDALLFYRKIAAFGKEHLNAGGAIYCEINSALGKETEALFLEMGYKTVIPRKDMQENDRMIKALL